MADPRQHADLLRPNPDWHAAATELVIGLSETHDTEDRLRLLDKLCQALGDELYPAFLQLLLTIDQYGDASAKQVVADTLAHAVATARLPSGKMNAWGATATVGGGGFQAYRNLGPLEYLCTWYAQPNGLPPLTQGAFRHVLESLLTLVSSSESGQTRYREKLFADCEDVLNGTLSMQTRAGIRALAEHWQADVDAGSCVDAFLNAVRQDNSLSQIVKNPFT